MFVTVNKLNNVIEVLRDELLSKVADSSSSSADEDFKIRQVVQRVTEKTIYDLQSTEKKINTSFELIQKDIVEMQHVMSIDSDTLRQELKSDTIVLRHELDLIKKEVDVMVKIVCHMSGAKDSGNSKEHFFDEVLRRLAKLENREDTENGK